MYLHGAAFTALCLALRVLQGLGSALEETAAYALVVALVGSDDASFFLGPAPLDLVFIIFAPSSRPGDLARDGVLLVLGLGVGAVLRENRVVTFLRERTRIDSLDDTLAASCVFSD